MGRWVGIVTPCEVTVVGRNDGVRLAFLDITTIPTIRRVQSELPRSAHSKGECLPLPNARTTSVSQDQTPKVFKRLELTVSFNLQT